MCNFIDSTLTQSLPRRLNPTAQICNRCKQPIFMAYENAFLARKRLGNMISKERAKAGAAGVRGARPRPATIWDTPLRARPATTTGRSLQPFLTAGHKREPPSIQPSSLPSLPHRLHPRLRSTAVCGPEQGHRALLLASPHWKLQPPWPQPAGAPRPRDRVSLRSPDCCSVGGARGRALLPAGRRHQRGRRAGPGLQRSFRVMFGLSNVPSLP